ncbi:MAG: class II aldolase/adducin family protein [Lentimicrobium sp.]|jgi:ribulose-5-phosphate 4-epimerase/fuculose-1-phosphate aldolase|uniref:class II aldolase/adducin family protein n=1 Tax=Lentimicrobium sp. TaxID=2034841 RepID=UPI0025D0F98E|nr:class II aldolase/adducin family protein [Lentimicrobium sp.]MCO5256560.1 class II aldolase/adducin family protein [Lentimicrobium sp.]MCO5261364.1 class II aldolase/adducin family protein [Lentimicrobium sp.]HRW68957.1 class II aldolase/adducin family protein [Lentimicrobium sp.]
MIVHPFPEEEIKSFIHWAHEAERLGLVTCSSGNLSHRVGDGCMLISTTGSWLGQLEESQIALLSTGSGEILNGRKASGESAMHRAIMGCRPDIDTVLHFQSPAATTLACMDLVPDYNVIIEVPVYIGKISCVPFVMPGSQMLAEAVAAEMMDSSIVQMRNHGQVVCGSGYAGTIQKAVFFELACTIILQSNMKALPLPEVSIQQLKHYIQVNN